MKVVVEGQSDTIVEDIENMVRSYVEKSDADKLHRRLVRLKSTNRTRERLRRDGFLGLFVHKVDLLDYHEKKLQDLEVNKQY
ncbi:CSC1-like protein HYP1 [Camellia lanceoleosa]|uniref:CSC1-like protein HYP1 n=1 Tax=Camellia lanceoleosa TaxID=1840588 RepID=A0ACC0FCE8_9ERIC|nr:CSC1-like protein HYP1 [Camellia lanceoleosa]